MVEPSKLKNGEFLSLHQYYRVTSVDRDYVHCVDTAGLAVKIGRTVVSESMQSTTQFKTEKCVTRTQLAQIISNLGHASFRVTFHKQVDANVVADGLANEDLSSQAKRRKVVKGLFTGEKRVMHARLHRSMEDEVEMELGRFKVCDLEVPIGETNLRMVDTRTVSEVIAEGCRYYVK
jgi:hypothetical protein